MVITIPGEVPSWNVFYAGVHHRVRSSMKNEWRLRVKQALDEMEGGAQVFERPVNIWAHAYYTGVAIDSDNVCIKLVIDGLKGRVIKNDSPKHVHWVSTRSSRGPEAKVVITIKEAE